MLTGFVGLGNMGAPIAHRLLAAGHELVINDLDAERVRQLAAEGASVAHSPREVADRAETVFASLPSPAVVKAVALGDEGVHLGTRVRRFVDLSTTGAAMEAEIAAALAGAGVSTVDSPVSGGVSGARGGTLAVMVACSPADFAAVADALGVLGRVFHVGEIPGQGQTMKLLNNYLSATALAATSEAFVFGAKAGLDPQLMVDVVNAGSGRNSATEDKFPRAVLPGTFDVGFTIALMCKDLRLFAEQAEALSIPLWVGAGVQQLWMHARGELGEDSDITQIVQPLERWAGTEVRSAGGGDG